MLVVRAQIGRLDTGKEKEKGKPRKASNIVTAKEERVSNLRCCMPCLTSSRSDIKVVLHSKPQDESSHTLLWEDHLREAAFEDPIRQQADQ